MTDKSISPHTIEFHLADHCNLNCAGCSHFAPLVSGEVFATLEQFNQDLSALKQVYDDVYEIRLMGGEPLLHPEINNFITLTRQMFTKARIAVVTNGVLLPTMPSLFWQTCAANKVRIKISNYPIHPDFKKVKRIGKEYGVKIKVPEKINIFFQFINIKGDSDALKSFRACRAMYTTPFVRNGRLYTCSFAPHVYLFNEYFDQNLPITELDSIQLLGGVAGADVQKYLNNPIPLCKWCKTERTGFGWHRSNLDIAEWINGQETVLSSQIEIFFRKAISTYHRIRQDIEMRARKYED
jgi:hypothetical protein